MALNLGDPVNVDGDPVTTDSDVEELETKLKEAEKKAKRRTVFGLAFSLFTLLLGIVI